MASNETAFVIDLTSHKRVNTLLRDVNSAYVNLLFYKVQILIQEHNFCTWVVFIYKEKFENTFLMIVSEGEYIYN